MEQNLYKRLHKTGVTGHDPAKAEAGLVLFSPLAHVNVTYLINMAGEVVHQWNHDAPHRHLWAADRRGQSVHGRQAAG